MRETPPRARVAGNATPPAAWLQPSPQADDAASRRLARSEGAHQVVSSRPPRWHVGAVPRESEDGAGDRAACAWRRLGRPPIPGMEERMDRPVRRRFASHPSLRHPEAAPNSFRPSFPPYRGSRSLERITNTSACQGRLSFFPPPSAFREEEHTTDLQSLMRI